MKAFTQKGEKVKKAVVFAAMAFALMFAFIGIDAITPHEAQASHFRHFKNENKGFTLHDLVKIGRFLIGH